MKSIVEMWDIIKYVSKHIMGVLEREKRGKEKIIEEEMVEKFPNLMKSSKLHI